MKKNVLVAQSGGPSSAINATLAGVVEQALMNGEKVDKVYGARHGIKGVLEDWIIDIGTPLSAPAALTGLIHTPSSALGSCRFKMKSPADDPACYKTIFERLRQYNIGYFVYIGGNDSMDTVNRLSVYAAENGIKDIFIMGAPKTIDNDLFGMDHSPGFASAAKYIATSFAEIWCDARVYDYPTITIVETMGRHVGWLCAASAVARAAGDAPHLIYLPEVAFDKQKFIEDVQEKMKTNTAVVIAISEGIHWADGTYVCEDASNVKVDAFGHKQMSGAAKVLEGILGDVIDCKIRCVDFSLMQRCAGHLASSVDLFESRTLGSISLAKALEGVSGHVSVLNRVSDNPYRVAYSSVPATTIANKEKAVPREWINKRGNDVTEDLVRYVTPLLGGVFGSDLSAGYPKHVTLW
ncbi:MAG: 6-phosphofructokinase [Oscillospiraceae bacterium]|nr:6-phosphofructokinase [Oscillospiraceae bacterium]